MNTLYRTRDKRFSIVLEEDKYIVYFECDKIVYSNWVYSYCLRWLAEHEYISKDELLQEMDGFQND